MTPPRWSEALLRLILIDRDRETVSGDLLEEYREVALPTMRPDRAGWWYRRQVAGILWRSSRLPLAVGLGMGTAVGIANLIDTARRPLANDDPHVMLMWAAGLVIAWAVTASLVTRRTRRAGDTIVAGLLLGATTMLVFDAAGIARVNLFLAAIRHRDDWRHLVAAYRDSGSPSPRSYANYVYLRQTPLVVGIGAVAGSVSGCLAAIANRVLLATKTLSREHDDSRRALAPRFAEMHQLSIPPSGRQHVSDLNRPTWAGRDIRV